MSKPKIAVVVGSTRPGRFADHPAQWILERASEKDAFDVELVDLRDYKLPLPPIVQIDAEGRYFVNNSEVINSRIETLKSALQQQGGDPAKQSVVLRADARTQHQAVVTAMDALAQTGYRNLSIATVRASESP